MMLSETFLGIIAAATVVMAVVQTMAALQAARAAREASKAMQQVQREIAPIAANLRRASEDAARVAALALTQAERVDHLVTTFQTAILEPIRRGAEMLAWVKSMLEVLGRRHRAERAPGERPSEEEGEEDLFIG